MSTPAPGDAAAGDAAAGLELAGEDVMAAAAAAAAAFRACRSLTRWERKARLATHQSGIEDTEGIPVAFATGSSEADKEIVNNTQSRAEILTACVYGDPAAGNFPDAAVTPVRTTPTPIEVVHTRPLAAWQMGTTSWDNARAPCAGPGVVGG